MSIDDRHVDADTDLVKDATEIALRSVLDPLLELMFDAGVTVQEFNRIAKEQAVRIATKRVRRDTGKESKSRVAILTGLPRYEVARTLKSTEDFRKTKDALQPARRILSAWHDDPLFLDATGIPATLPIFGRRRSFERLVLKYGSGLPVRAMLDELILLDAVELNDAQHLRAKSRVPVIRGLSTRSVASIGERARDLLATLRHNIRVGEQPFFEATAVTSEIDPDLIGMIRREISEQGTNLINGATSLLNRSRMKRSTRLPTPNSSYRVGVTVYYFQESLGPDADLQNNTVRRKNLQRAHRKRRSPIGFVK